VLGVLLLEGLPPIGDLPLAPGKDPQVVEYQMTLAIPYKGDLRAYEICQMTGMQRASIAPDVKKCVDTSLAFGGMRKDLAEAFVEDLGRSCKLTYRGWVDGASTLIETPDIDFKVLDRLHASGARIRVVTRLDDTTVPPVESQHLASMIPGSELVVRLAEGYGHGMYFVPEALEKELAWLDASSSDPARNMKATGSTGGETLPPGDPATEAPPQSPADLALDADTAATMEEADDAEEDDASTPADDEAKASSELSPKSAVFNFYGLMESPVFNFY